MMALVCWILLLVSSCCVLLVNFSRAEKINTGGDSTLLARKGVFPTLNTKLWVQTMFLVLNAHQLCNDDYITEGLLCSERCHPSGETLN